MREVKDDVAVGEMKNIEEGNIPIRTEHPALLLPTTNASKSALHSSSPNSKVRSFRERKESLLEQAVETARTETQEQQFDQISGETIVLEPNEWLLNLYDVVMVDFSILWNVRELFEECKTTPGNADFAYVVFKSCFINLLVRSYFICAAISSHEMSIVAGMLSVTWYQLQDVVFTLWGQTYLKFLGKTTPFLKIFNREFGDLLFVIFQLFFFELLNRLIIGPVGDNPSAYTMSGVGLIFVNILQGLISSGPVDPAINKMRETGLVSHKTAMHLYQLSSFTMLFGLTATFGYQTLYFILRTTQLILAVSIYVFLTLCRRKSRSSSSSIHFFENSVFWWMGGTVDEPIARKSPAIPMKGGFAGRMYKRRNSQDPNDDNNTPGLYIRKKDMNDRLGGSSDDEDYDNDVVEINLNQSPDSNSFARNPMQNPPLRRKFLPSWMMDSRITGNETRNTPCDDIDAENDYESGTFQFDSNGGSEKNLTGKNRQTTFSAAARHALLPRGFNNDHLMSYQSIGENDSDIYGTNGSNNNDTIAFDDIDGKRNKGNRNSKRNRNKQRDDPPTVSIIQSLESRMLESKKSRKDNREQHQNPTN